MRYFALEIYAQVDTHIVVYDEMGIIVSKQRGTFEEYLRPGTYFIQFDWKTEKHKISLDTHMAVTQVDLEDN